MTRYSEFTIPVHRPVRHVERVVELVRREPAVTPQTEATPPAAPDLQSLLWEMTAALHQWKSAHDEFATTFREAVVQLSLAIAERVVRHHIDADAYNLPDLLDEIWSRLDQGAADLFLHPQDLTHLQQAHGDWLREHLEDSPLQLRPDPNLPRGTCRVEARQESFLAGVDVECAGLAEWLKGDASA